MQPTDVVVITLDGHIHRVASRANITVAVPTGAIVTMDGVHPETGAIAPTQIRQHGPVTQTPGTRFTCGCGLSFDAQNTELGTDPRWTQGGKVNCPKGC